MTERPIIMPAGSVLAILAGRKTQTRRVIEPQPTRLLDKTTTMVWSHRHRSVYGTHSEMANYMRAHCRYGQSGDRLWVREKWSPYADESTKRYCQSRDTERGETPKVAVYAADYTHGSPLEVGGEKHWRSPRSMPHWASRITLELVKVRVERLQDITKEDAIAEGVECHMVVPWEKRFASLWDIANIKRGYPWQSNPWVWVVEFKRIGGAE